MFLKSVLTAVHPASTAVGSCSAAGGEKINSRHRLAILLAVGVLGLAALAPIGASACGGVPASADAPAPVAREAAAPQGARSQPVIMPHCSFSPMPNRVAASGSGENPSNQISKSAGPVGRAD
jgi:hypothetical protein